MMRGLCQRPAAWTVLVTALVLGACGGTPGKPKVHEGRGTAFIPRSLLETTPCITEALRSTFGVSPETDHSYSRWEGAGPNHYKLKYIVRPNAAASGVAEDAGQQLAYEIYNKGRAGTGIVYTVQVTRGSVSEWLAQAAIPLEQCGATVGKR